MVLLASSGGFDLHNPYWLIIMLSAVIILSYFFNELAKKTSIPSVLMLIILGVVIRAVGGEYMPDENELSLELLGKIGLIMIVLEAALELDLKREKLGLIGKALGAAAVGLIGTTFAIAGIIDFALPEMGWSTALVYATPLGIMSSAIIIPSVGNLVEHKKEFMIYESTFSDIFGIMLFYFLIDVAKEGNLGATALNFSGSLLLTIVLSVIFSYILVMIFQQIKSTVKLFLLIAILLLLYALGSLIGLSPLWIVLIFGLVLSNYKIFFQGPMRNWVNPKRVHAIEKDFFILTIETAFVIRTFFFVLFGYGLHLASLLDIKVLLMGVLIVIAIYLVRWICLKIFLWKNFVPQLWIAPRGLITILLFMAIPVSMQTDSFSSGVLLTVILISSVIMTWAMINDGGQVTALAGEEALLGTEAENAASQAAAEAHGLPTEASLAADGNISEVDANPNDSLADASGENPIDETIEEIADGLDDSIDSVDSSENSIDSTDNATDNGNSLDKDLGNFSDGIDTPPRNEA